MNAVHEFEGAEFRLKGLEAALVGSTNDTVLLFVAADAYNVNSDNTVFQAAISSAADGTSIRILKSGIYMAILNFGQVTGAADLLMAITRDSTFLTTDPNPVTASTETIAYGFLDRSGNDTGLTINASFVVTPAQAAAGGVVIRAQASDGADGPPANVVAANVRFSMYRIGDQT